jgi:tetratricopeptide (TPR) repeat protein
MSDIPLRKYLEEIDGLIDKQQIDEAIAHCRHILSFYPKHIDTYRALGKALLEKGRHGDAADIFQRVLSSVPDDFVSHVGMSIVREDEANLEAALWHMERAFEANPANGPIQEELRRLYGRRDGVVPPKARLTRGALARMYAKGELYPQAEAELRAALAADPERVDLATVLAQVYWGSDQRAEAAATCDAILQKLPYSHEANRIIAALLMAQGRTNDAVPYRQRLEALDPYAAFVDPATDGQGAFHVNPDAVRIPALDYLPGMAETATGSPDWMQSLGESFEAPAAPAESMPDWLSESPLAEAPAAAPLAADLPDWMQEIQPGAPAPAAAESAAPDWLADIAATPAAPAEDMPDWLKKATGPLNKSMMARPAEPEPEAAPPPAAPVAEPAPDESIPTWLKPSTGPLSESDLPDWMKTGVLPPVPSPAVAPPPAPAPKPAEEIPDWLRPATDRLSPDELPDWMKTGVLPPVPSPAAAPSAPPAPEGEIPDWLKASAPMPEAAAPSAEDEIPDWLKAATARPSAFVETPDVAGADLGGDESLRWLEGLAAQQGAKPEELITQAPAEAAPSPFEEPAAVPSSLDEMPSWMREIAPQAEPEGDALGTAPLSPDSLPEWMKSSAGEAESEAPGTAALPAAEIPAWMRPAPGPVPAPPPDSAPEIELPEWMKPVAGETEEAALPAAEEPALPREDVSRSEVAGPTLSTAEGKPDWLKQMEAEADQYEASVASQPAPPPSTLPEAMAAAKLPVELPDFLQPASAEAIARAEQPTALADEAETAEAEPPSAEMGELPDWIKAMAPVEPAAPPAEVPSEAAPPAAPPPVAEMPLAPAQPDLSTMDSDEALRWLEGLALQQGAKPEEMVAQPAPGPAGTPEWLRPPSAEPEAPETPPADVPTWAEPREPGPSDSVANWLAGKQPPEWLRQPGEQAPMPPADWLRAPVEEEAAPAAEAAPAEPGAPAAPGPGEMGEDEALRWLEGLAAQQGAQPEELITQRDEFATRLFGPPATGPEAVSQPPSAGPEDLPDFLRKREAVEPSAVPEAASSAEIEAPPADEIPDWLKQMESAPAPEAESPAVEDAGSAATGTPAEEIPDWLKQAEASIPAEIAPAAGEAAAPAEPDLSTMSAEEALRWLEGLAAQQGARPDELLTKPEERLAQPPAWIAEQAAAPEAAPSAEIEVPPAEEIPDWLKQMEAAPAAEAEPPAPAEEIPDWLKQAEASMPAETAPAAGEAAAPAEPDLSTMSAEEALRWLEGLAAQQGARPDELLTKPEERLAQPPAWIAEQAVEDARGVAAGAPEPHAEVEPPQPSGTAGLPPSLAAALEETFEAPAPLEPQPEAEAPAAPGADLGAMSAEEALRWLEGLAAQQGAKPDELLTKPEERLAQPPTWIAAQPPVAEPPAEPEPLQPSGAAGLPPSLAAALEETQAPAAAMAPPEAPAPPEVTAPAPEAAPPEKRDTSTSALSRLAEKLAESRRARDAEIAARFEAQRTQQEAARLEVQRKMEEKRAAGKKGTGRLGTGPLGEKKGTGPLGTGPLEPKPETGPLPGPAPEAAAPEPAIAARPAPLAAEAPPPAAPAVSRPAPKRRPKAPVRPRGRAAKSPYAVEPPDSVFAIARRHLDEERHEDAVEAMGFLVATGQMVDDVIVEIEQRAARRRPTPPLLRVLGDAYMKNNRLQKALDTYRQALGQL